MGRQNAEPWVQLATEIPEMLRRALRRYCARTGMRVAHFVAAAVREKLAREGRHQRLTSRRRGVERRDAKKRREMAVT